MWKKVCVMFFKFNLYSQQKDKRKDGQAEEHPERLLSLNKQIKQSFLQSNFKREPLQTGPNLD